MTKLLHIAALMCELERKMPIMGADGAAVNLRYKGGVIALQADIGSLFHFTACHTGRFPFIISDNGKL